MEMKFKCIFPWALVVTFDLRKREPKMTSLSETWCSIQLNWGNPSKDHLGTWWWSTSRVHRDSNEQNPTIWIKSETRRRQIAYIWLSVSLQPDRSNNRVRNHSPPLFTGVIYNGGLFSVILRLSIYQLRSFLFLFYKRSQVLLKVREWIRTSSTIVVMIVHKLVTGNKVPPWTPPLSKPLRVPTTIPKRQQRHCLRVVELQICYVHI